MARAFRIQSTSMGIMEVWFLHIEEELPVHCENDNDHDPFAVTIPKDDTIVGHVLWEISQLFFLHRKSGSEMTYQLDGNRGRSAVEGKDW